MTIQVVFAVPAAISSEILEPDTLALTIKQPEIFIDAETNEALDTGKLEFKRSIG